jgi:hypothetical protein
MIRSKITQARFWTAYKKRFGYDKCSLSEVLEVWGKR